MVGEKHLVAPHRSVPALPQSGSFVNTAFAQPSTEPIYPNETKSIRTIFCCFLAMDSKTNLCPMKWTQATFGFVRLQICEQGGSGEESTQPDSPTVENATPGNTEIAMVPQVLWTASRQRCAPVGAAGFSAALHPGSGSSPQALGVARIRAHEVSALPHKNMRPIPARSFLVANSLTPLGVNNFPPWVLVLALPQP